ncbi:MFS transporter [Fructilactobacillus vespulae]|uniref:MFS transporter n=1 Tax=Fructilactobacillus vespulae TaxID=1249630 RepID=UPI0039B6A499
MKNTKNSVPKVSNGFLFYLSFGILGTQMAFGLESSQLGRLFQTIGAKPELLGMIFIIPPLTGLVMQPIIGKYSDKTWIPQLGGRRMPYLIVGTIFTMITLILLPNSGSFGWTSSTAVIVASLIVGVFMLASNVCIQPYKMLVGDMVNSDQKGKAYSIQSLLANIGSVIAAMAPFILTALGVSNTAPKGVVPDSVLFAFYIAAAAIATCSLVTILLIKEFSPDQFRSYHGITENENTKSMVNLLKEAPKVFWLVGLVNFFAFLAFGYLWIYGSGAISANIYNSIDPKSIGYQKGANLFGVFSALYALSAVVVSLMLTKVKKKHYVKVLSASMLIGGIGFIVVFLSHTVLLTGLAFVMVGVGWAGLLVYPLTMVSDSISEEYIGTYLGLFNIQLCIPQIVASILSVVILPLVNGSMPMMILISGVSMLIGGIIASLIKLK